MNPFEYAINFEPKICRPNKSAWVHHLHFAACLIASSQPKILVELGTHWGDSYFTFCQAINELNIGTISYAVDTWEGEQHAGTYDHSIFDFVNAYNSTQYSGRSHLLRETFDTANEKFDDASIDLLHIDGLHTYEAVSKDFQKWYPKVSPQGIILFHDITCRHADFGVWELWREIKDAGYTTLEFDHGYGLGVLIKDLENVPISFKDLFLNKNAHDQHNTLAALKASSINYTKQRILIETLESEKQAIKDQLEANSKSFKTLENIDPQKDITKNSIGDARRKQFSLSSKLASPFKAISQLRLGSFASTVHQTKQSRRVRSAHRTKGIQTIDTTLENKFIALKPIRFHKTNNEKPRITIVTDSVNKGSLFGGVSTAIIYASYWAIKNNASIRLITRFEAPESSSVSMIQKLNQIDFGNDLECLFYPHHETEEISIYRDEVILTTSWWTTQCIINSGFESKITYLLQEDERMFYPVSDEYILASETMANRNIKFVVNSHYLYEHLLHSKFTNIQTNGTFFEPSFSQNYYYCDGPVIKTKYQLFFYARPHHARNAYYRGLKILSEAVKRGLFAPEEWTFNFVGKDVPQISIDGIEIRLHDNISWNQYTTMIRNMDLGLSLMLTPHTSYPPLDVAASGGVVVTNNWGNKRNIGDRYSANIISCEIDEDAMIEGLTQGVKLAKSPEQRYQNYKKNKIRTSWAETLSSIL